MQEMPASNALYGYFKGKDIIFLYLAVQSQEKIWKSVIADKKIAGEHYLLKNSQYNALSKKFSITGVPHYVIVDKLGYVKEENALPPNNTALKKELESLLK